MGLQEKGKPFNYQHVSSGCDFFNYSWQVLPREGLLKGFEQEFLLPN